MRFGVGVRFPSPDSVALVSRTTLRSRAGAVGGGKISLSAKASSRQMWKPGLGSVPIITSTSFSIGTNPGFNAVIGTVNATNSPTSFAITSGNPSGFFAITSAGVLRTGAAASPQDNVYSLTITATNSFGTSPPATISVTVGAVPVVSDQSMNLLLPATNGQAVGTVPVTGGTPTGFAITAGNSAGYFAINSTGDITVTSAGASGITAQTYSLTVQATNALGSDTGVVSVVASASASVPMSKSDSRFAGNTNGNAIPNTGTLSNKTWDDSPGYATGDALVGWAPFTTLGTVTVSKCIFDGREGPRLTGGNSTSCAIVFDECYFHCVGKGATDHADALQAFANQGNDGRGTITIKNSYIRGYTLTEAQSVFGAGFVESTSFLYADGWSGNVIFDNVVFHGAYRLLIGADSGSTTNVSFRNCHFVNHGVVDLIAVGSGVLNLLEWTNNRDSSIVSGAIVPGPLRPPP
jgi:hypothetical protein